MRGRLLAWGASGTARDGGLLAGVAAAGAGLLAAGFDWTGWAPRVWDAVAIAGAALIVGAVGRRIAGIPAAVAALAGTVALAALVFEGFAGTAAGILVLAAGAAAGTLLPRAVDPLVRWVAGIGLLAAVLGWLLPWPIHQPAVWALLALLLTAVRAGALRGDLRVLRGTFAPLLAQAPLASLAWALVCVVAGATAWLPINNPDDLAYHLTVGQELLRYGHGRLDIGAQAWALAPWSSDLAHALVSLLAGRDSTGVLNTGWLLASALLIVRLGSALGLRAAHAWLASALYASLPLTSFLAGSLQTEAATAAVLVALAFAIGFDPAPRPARVFVIAALAGFLLGMKISNALLLAPLGFWWMVAWWRAMPWRSLAAAVPAGVFAGGSSYAYAWALTGNPVVPMFNAWFRTPWFPLQNFEDATWQTGVPWDTPWRLVFQTGGYFEGQPGAAGIVLLLLLGGLLSALATPRTRAVVLVATTALLLVFWQVQYLRYLHPALALWIPGVVAALLPAQPAGARVDWRAAVLWATVLLQLALVGKSGWMLQQGALRTLLLEGRAAVSDRYVPERSLLERWETALQPTDRVLLADPLRSFTSLLAGRSVGTAWFTPLLASVRTAGDAAVEATWANVVQRAGTNHVLVFDLPSHPGLQRFLAQRDAVRLDANGAAELYWLPPAPDRAADGAGSGPGADAPSGGPASADGAPAAAAVAAVREARLPVGRQQPVLGQAVLEVACDRPGEPIAVGWTLTAPGAPSVSHWEWAACGMHDRALAGMQFQAIAHAQELVASVAPAKPASTMAVTITGHRLDLRRDFHAQTALSAWLAGAGHCGQGCSVPAGSLLPLTRGPMLR